MLMLLFTSLHVRPSAATGWISQCLDLNYCLSISVFTKLQKQAINVNTNMGNCLSNDLGQFSFQFNCVWQTVRRGLKNILWQKSFSGKMSLSEKCRQVTLKLKNYKHFFLSWVSASHKIFIFHIIKYIRGLFKFYKM